MKIPVVKTDFSDIGPVKKGKVRDIYDIGDFFLMVATDRLSAFDVVLPDGIPGKGKVLTGISSYWFRQVQDIVGNHLVSDNVDDYPKACLKYKDILKGRSMLVKKAEPLPVECIVRGYISGSGWESYKQNGSICGIELPQGLKESDKLAEPIYTPSTKAGVGDHDVNVNFNETLKILGREKAEKIRDLSISIYLRGAENALKKGIIIADTKFEFGIVNGEIILIDEVMTPDSSRFWPLDSYCPGQAQKSYDKQYIRDWLISSGWNKKAPGPRLPEQVIMHTAKKYAEVMELLTSD